MLILFAAYVTLWNAHHIEAIESYCKEYNAKYADVTKEAGLILVETINLLIGLQASDVRRYSLEPFLVTRNSFGADPTVAVVQLETNFKVCNLKKNLICKSNFIFIVLFMPNRRKIRCARSC